MKSSICIPYKQKPYKTEKLIFKKNNIKIYRSIFGGNIRYRMYKGEYYLSTLVSEQTFEDQYKKECVTFCSNKAVEDQCEEDLDAWIEATKNADIAKVKESKEAVKIALQECDLIESLWEE